IRTQRKRPPVQARQASEYCHNIAKLSVSPEPSCPHGCDVGREPNTQKIDVMDRPLFVLQPQNVACLSASSDDRLHSMFDPAIAEVPQERISGTQRQKCECWPGTRTRRRKQPVDDFVGSSVSAHSQKPAITARVSITRQFRSRARPPRFDNIELHPRCAQPL